jgi:hypothetical protein
MVLRNIGGGAANEIIAAIKKIIAFRFRANAFPSRASFLLRSG